MKSFSMTSIFLFFLLAHIKSSPDIRLNQYKALISVSVKLDLSLENTVKTIFRLIKDCSNQFSVGSMPTFMTDNILFSYILMFSFLVRLFAVSL